MFKIFRRSLRNTLIALVAGMVTLATVSVGVLTFNAASNALGDAAQRQMEAIAQAKEGHIVTIVQGRQAQAGQVAAMPNVRALLASTSSEIAAIQAQKSAAVDELNAIVERGEFARFALVRPNGVIMASTRAAEEGQSLAAEAWWQQALRQPTAGGLVREEGGATPVCRVSQPVLGEGARVLGVVLGYPRARALYALLEERQGLGETGETYLTNRDGLLLSASRFVRNAEFSLRNQAGALRQIQSGNSGGKTWLDYQGDSVVGYTMFDDLDAAGLHEWVLVAEINEDEIMAPAGRLRNQIALFTAVLLIVSFVLAYVMARSVTAPITRIATAADQIGKGDLSVQLDGGNHAGEVGLLMASFGTMTSNLREIMKSLQSGVGSLSANASQITATAKEYAGTASEQASAIAETSTTVEEIKQTSRAAAESAKAVVDSADRAAGTGQEGRDAIGNAVATMTVIGERVGGIAGKILQLSEQTTQIGEIVESVNDLAEQSNLLAVNASIEAAKAGEQGRGFAVVAGEVRNLAEQSKRATQQIRAILGQIQKATESAVMATEEGTKRAEDGKRAVETVRVVVEKLAATLEQNADSARQIAGAASQQASGVAQVSETLEAIARAGRDSASGVQALEQSVAQLSGFSGELKQIVARYRA